ncbi:MAG: hypothetical protein NW214_16350 [Pseudanabaenaceae cyanobacterium bins.39]|nr:hypothetical protein [Pseudanabaenaceae cyanobacterium bins.39]
MFAILKMDVRKPTKLENTDLATNKSLNQMTDEIKQSPDINNDVNTGSSVSSQELNSQTNHVGAVSKDVPSYSVDISPELFIELLEISNNPAATVDEAIRWWLRRRTLDTMGAVQDRRDRLGMRSHRSLRSLQNTWND